MEPDSGESAGVRLRVVTFNIRNGLADDGVDSWRFRRHRTVGLLRRLAFDVAGLQEVYAFQLEDILEAVPHVRVIGVGRDDGDKAGEYAPILFDPNRLTLIDSGSFWFSSTPDVAGSADWGNVNVRICTWGAFQDALNGREISVFNVHLDHISAASRERSVELLRQRIRTRPSISRVIVTGDFNAGEQDPAIEAMRLAELRDSFRLAHADATDVGTFHGFSGTYQEDKIDYIWVDRSWKVLEAGIVRDQVDGGWPSDHAAVTATLV